MQCLQGPAAPLQMHAAAAARPPGCRLATARIVPCRSSPGCQLSSGLQTIVELNGSGQQRAANNAGDRHSGSVAFAGEQALAFRSVAALDFEGCRVQAPRCASQLSGNCAAHPQAIHC